MNILNMLNINLNDEDMRLIIIMSLFFAFIIYTERNKMETFTTLTNILLKNTKMINKRSIENFYVNPYIKNTQEYNQRSFEMIDYFKKDTRNPNELNENTINVGGIVSPMTEYKKNDMYINLTAPYEKNYKNSDIYVSSNVY